MMSAEDIQYYPLIISVVTNKFYLYTTYAPVCGYVYNTCIFEIAVPVYF